MTTFILHDGALGDVLLSLPCFHAIRSDSQSVQIAARPDAGRFLQDAGIVTSWLSTDDALFATLYSKPAPNLAAFLGRFERAYVFTVHTDSPAVSAMRGLVPGTRVIKTVPPGEVKIHAAAFRYAQLIPGAPLPVPPALSLSGERLAHAQCLLNKAGYKPGTRLLAVHTGSGGKRKCWPIELYFETIESLQAAHDVFVVLFSGQAEDREMQEKIEAFAYNRKGIYMKDLDLMTSASLLSLCDVYIGNDSGFSHLAAAAGRASLVLFGPTDPGCWAPIGRNVHVISAPEPSSLKTLSPGAVYQAAAAVSGWEK